MTDTVVIRELRCKAIIGCWAWERQVPQQVVVDLAIDWDCAAAAATDQLEQALDYAAVSAAVIRCLQDGRFRLAEAAAEAVAALVLQEFGAPAVHVTLVKPRAVAEAAAVGVSIERRAPA